MRLIRKRSLSLLKLDQLWRLNHSTEPEIQTKAEGWTSLLQAWNSLEKEELENVMF